MMNLLDGKSQANYKTGTSCSEPGYIGHHRITTLLPQLYLPAQDSMLHDCSRLMTPLMSRMSLSAVIVAASSGQTPVYCVRLEDGRVLHPRFRADRCAIARHCPN